MLKRLTVAVAALFALAAQAIAAGTMQYSLSQQLDEFGRPLAGCKLYLIQAGTVSTPQNGYQDSGLTLVLPNPLTCDAAGRLPQFFLADGSIKIRLTKSNGVNVVTADGILVIGASSGGGGGSPVDPTTVIATGDVKVRYGTGVLTGFVRMNGRTIGSATSGATERANADAQALFEYLWTTDANLAVSSGRGATANADWVANKVMTLPDMRGRKFSALADMGNTATTILTTNTCTTPTVLGTQCGAESHAITQGHLPSYTLPNTLGISNTLGLNDPGHTHSTAQLWGNWNGVNNDLISPAPGNSGTRYSATNSIGTGITLTGGVAITGSVTSGGSAAAFYSTSPIMLITTYIKL